MKPGIFSAYKETGAKHALRILKDDVIPDSGKAKIRVVSAASGAPSIAVSIAGSTKLLFNGIAFRSDAGFTDVKLGTVALDVRGKNNAKVLLGIPKLALKRGTATTIVIEGTGLLSFFSFTDTPLAATPK